MYVSDAHYSLRLTTPCPRALPAGRRLPASAGARRSSRLASVLVLAFVVVLLAATPALAEQTHLLLSTFNGSPPPGSRSAPHNLVGPTGVAVDNSGGTHDGEVYVAEGEPENEEGSVIDCFNASGEYLSQINGSETVQKSFAAAGARWGLAVDPSNGNLYTALPGLGVVDKFEPVEAGCGKVVPGFGSEGQVSGANIAEGQLGSSVGVPAGAPFAPNGIAVDPTTREVFIGDEGNNVIDVFDANGKYLRQFAVNGPPASIAIDSHGHVFVVSFFSEVDVYEAATGILSIAYGSGTGVLDKGDSISVAVDPNTENVYVADVDFETEVRNINQYEGSTLISSFGASALAGLSQIAVGKANPQHIYVTNNGGYVSVFGPLVTLAVPTTEPATEVKPGSAVLNGSVNPNGAPVRECYFEYEYARNGVTEGHGLRAECEPDAKEIPKNDSPDSVHAKIALAPDVAYTFRLVAVNSETEPITQKGSDETIALPTAEADAIHTVNGDGKMSIFGVVNPDGADTHYRFEFLTERQFEEGAWADSVSTPEQDVGAGAGGELVFQEIPTLPPGASYRFRVTAESAVFPDDPQHSPVKNLLVPAPVAEQAQPPCPNEAERSGPSARLPDCRAYEQVTPANKEGALDNFDYRNGEETVVGLDGEHFFMSTLSKWGRNVGGNDTTTYSFTRTPEEWKMSSLSPQPQTGGVFNKPYRFYTPDLSQVLIEREWNISLYAASPTVEFALGPPGGFPPSGLYTTVASEPQEATGEGGRRAHSGHWVAQSRNGAVEVIESPDHKLIPGQPPTGTTAPILHGARSGQGFDLYEYSGGRLSQVNVYEGTTIGECGAELAQGREGGGARGDGQGSEGGSNYPPAGSVNAISADGSRIFFEAFPNGCPSEEEELHRLENGGGEPKIELYMRVGGTQTVDIGDYTFEGANPEGTRLFLSKRGANGVEFFSYDTETQVAKRLFSLEGGAIGPKHALSEDGNVFYFETYTDLTPEAPVGGAKIYSYDIASESMSFVAVSSAIEGDGNGGFYVSPDGGDFYFNVESVNGVSGGSANVQVYRYDSGEGIVQCVSCASPNNPEPKLISTLMPEYGPENFRLAPLGSPASADGDYVFFDTPAALLPQDINGEIIPYGGAIGKEFSPSSDAYEWRRNGIDGCGRVQGCLALITNGIDGTENVLLGTDPSGRDVFFATHSQLAPSDTDTSGDVYDARIGGGFPPPPSRPVECEGDACSTPASAPNDATPASFTFTGPGDLVPALSVRAAQNPPKVVKCPKGRVLAHGRCVKKTKARAKRGRGTRARRSGRSGR
jgi:DNA-binding beta-propeller fold protein YncE